MQMLKIKSHVRVLLIGLKDFGLSLLLSEWSYDGVSLEMLDEAMRNAVLLAEERPK